MEDQEKGNHERIDDIWLLYVHKEASDLTEAVKQTLYEEYLRAYGESNR